MTTIWIENDPTSCASGKSYNEVNDELTTDDGLSQIDNIED